MAEEVHADMHTFGKYDSGKGSDDEKEVHGMRIQIARQRNTLWSFETAHGRRNIVSLVSETVEKLTKAADMDGHMAPKVNTKIWGCPNDMASCVEFLFVCWFLHLGLLRIRHET